MFKTVIRDNYERVADGAAPDNDSEVLIVSVGFRVLDSSTVGTNIFVIATRRHAYTQNTRYTNDYNRHAAVHVITRCSQHGLDLWDS